MNARIVDAINDSWVRLVTVKCESVCHDHEEEIELFFSMKGRLTIKTRDRDVDLKEGEFVIIQRGVERKPVADEEARAMLLEKKTTMSTGKVRSERTAASRWV